MKRGFWTIWGGVALLLLCTPLLLPAQNPFRVVAYYPSWNRQVLPPAGIRLETVTHVLYAFAWPNADGSLHLNDAPLDTALINTVHRAGRKILLSFGGAGSAPTANFAAVAADSAIRQTFISNVVSYLLENLYDGADIDWEGPQNSLDRIHETALVRELRSAFSSAGRGWLLTMAVGVSDYSGQWHDFGSLRQEVDWFNAMCYDFHGSWSSHAGHNSPLYAPASDAADWSDDLGVTYLHQTRTVPAEQLALGIPFYGKEFRAAALYAPKTEPTIDILYGDAMNHLIAGWTYVWDDVSKVPYLQDSSRTRLDTFDDSLSVTIKCAYARDNGLSGVMIWALGQDLWQGGQPLMAAVRTALAGVSGVDERRSLPVANGVVLYDNYPNPFNPSTVISYQVAAGGKVNLTVYDLLGRQVAVLVNEVQAPGRYEVPWNASGFASGVYVCRLGAGSGTAVKRLIFMK